MWHLLLILWISVAWAKSITSTCSCEYLHEYVSIHRNPLLQVYTECLNLNLTAVVYIKALGCL